MQKIIYSPQKQRQRDDTPENPARSAFRDQGERKNRAQGRDDVTKTITDGDEHEYAKARKADGDNPAGRSIPCHTIGLSDDKRQNAKQYPEKWPVFDRDRIKGVNFGSSLPRFAGSGIHERFGLLKSIAYKPEDNGPKHTAKSKAMPQSEFQVGQYRHHEHASNRARQRNRDGKTTTAFTPDDEEEKIQPHVVSLNGQPRL
jgi:hypothetical protein